MRILCSKPCACRPCCELANAESLLCTGPLPARARATCPQASGELPIAPTPPRAADWVESAETVALLSSAGRHELLREETDALYRIAMGPHISAAQERVESQEGPMAHSMGGLEAGEVAAWYAARALEIDEVSGQLACAEALLEVAVEQRGLREPRLMELLRMAKALAGEYVPLL